MFNKYTAFLFFTILSTLAIAQSKTTLTGVLVQSNDKKGIAFATITLIDTTTKKSVSNTFTTETGKYTFTNIPEGIYTIQSKSIGFSTIPSKCFKVSNIPLSMDTLFADKSSTDLKEIIVEVAKPLLEIETDKIIYNVENDVTLLGLMALDALKKLPFVTVDAEDNIQVKGSSNFKVLLNGKNTSIVAKNPSEALKAFPTALIKKIEVITEPSAKYDAEGTAGIINIITQKKVKGYNGNLNANYNSRGMNNGSGSINIKLGKFGMSSYLSGNMFNYLNQTTSSLIRINKLPGYNTTLKQYGGSNSDGIWSWGNMELSYDFDTLHTFSIYASQNGSKSSGNSNQHSEISDSVGWLTDSFNTQVTYENKSPSLDIGFDFTKRFKDNEDHEISLSAYRDVNFENSSYTSIQNNLSNPDRDIFNTNHSKNAEHTVELEYEKPFKNESKLEAGTKLILRNLISDYRMLERSNALDDYLENSSQTNTLHYNQNIGSIYSVYMFPLKKYKIKLGGRAEQTWINASFNKDSSPVLNHYLNFIPTAGISRKIKKIHTLKLNFSKRIQRPWMFYLNPYINNQNPRSISYGNPNLLPEITHSASFSWNYFFKKNTLDISLSGALTDDIITSYTWLDVNDISYTTYYNIAKSNSLGLNVSYYGSLFKKLQVWASFKTSYVAISHKLDTGKNRSGFSIGGHGSTTYNFKHGFSTSLGAWVNRGAPTLQSIRPTNYSYTLSLRKSVLKKKLNLGLVANNFLEAKQSLKTITQDASFYSESIYNNSIFRYFSVSVSFNFGKLRENVSRKKGITNDDMKSGE